MIYFFFIIKSALFDFARNKLRTFLTSLGILIGVASVVLLIAFGLGLKKYINSQFESLGTNLLVIFPGRFQGNLSSSSFAAGVKFDEKDIVNLKRINGIVGIVPGNIKTVQIESGGNSKIADIYATSSDVFPVRNFKVNIGRKFTRSDVNKRNRVVVIGPKIAKDLYGSEEQAIDKTIRIEKKGFKVIGVFDSKGGGGFGGPDLDKYMLMPYKTFYIFNPEKKFYVIHIKATDKELIPIIKKQTKKVLLKRYDEDEFSIIEMTEILKSISSIFSVLDSILVGIGTISLVVGGVGIMNIMYVAVTERIKEIGIRRAIGATENDILFLFLAESILLSLFGGSLGLVISYIGVFFIQRFFPAYIDIFSVLIALGVSSIIGIIFGVFPAKKAANLSPIDAIKYE